MQRSVKTVQGVIFWNSEFLKLFIDLNKKENVVIDTLTPGGNYYSMLLNLARTSVMRAEKMLEYARPGGIVKSVPQPVPEPGTMHYKHVSDTPTEIDDNVREVDDFNPRIQLNKLIDSGFDGKCNETLDSFCTDFIVERQYVDNHLDTVLCRNVMKIAKDQKNVILKGKMKQPKHTINTIGKRLNQIY